MLVQTNKRLNRFSEVKQKECLLQDASLDLLQAQIFKILSDVIETNYSSYTNLSDLQEMSIVLKLLHNLLLCSNKKRSTSNGKVKRCFKNIT